jgi:hypothetical protein
MATHTTQTFAQIPLIVLVNDRAKPKENSQTEPEKSDYVIELDSSVDVDKVYENVRGYGTAFRKSDSLIYNPITDKYSIFLNSVTSDEVQLVKERLSDAIGSDISFSRREISDYVASPGVVNVSPEQMRIMHDLKALNSDASRATLDVYVDLLQKPDSRMSKGFLDKPYLLLDKVYNASQMSDAIMVFNK